MWIEDDEGMSPDEIVMKNKIHRLRGSWLEMHDKPASINARRYHKLEPHKGHMWAIAAYTLTAFRRCSDETKDELASLGFPLPSWKAGGPGGQEGTRETRETRETTETTESADWKGRATAETAETTETTETR